MSRVKSSATFGEVSAQNITTSGLQVSKATVSQSGAITSGCTINSPAGVITTVNTTLATGGSARFTVSNSGVRPSSVVLANVINYSGGATQGNVHSRINGVTQGSFSVVLTNTDAVNALNGTVKLGYLVI